MAKNIEINYKTENGYDTLLPNVSAKSIIDFSGENPLISDTTKELYGLELNSNVNDTFYDIYTRFIMISEDKARIVVKVTDNKSQPIPNIILKGLQDGLGNNVITNQNGIGIGFSEEGTITLSIENYADLISTSTQIEVKKGMTYNVNLANIETRNFLKITSTNNYMFSDNVSRVDVTAVGGGGGGSTSFYGGAGGGGGYCTVQENVTFKSNTFYEAIIGNGGYGYRYSSSSRAGGNGGASSFLGVIANGGNGGSNPINMDVFYGGDGNGKGGDRLSNSGKGTVNGVAGSVEGYSSFTETIKYGGGGGGTSLDVPSIDGIGAGYGGDSLQAGQNGFGGGGGQQAFGGSGCIAIRMFLKN